MGSTAGHPGYGGHVGSFDDLTDRVFKLYAGGEHASALSLAKSGFEQFPNRRATLIYWCACLKSLLSDPASALEDFKDGLAAGLWWAEPMLREDADLDGVRQLDAFAALLAESGRRWRKAMSGASPPPTIVPAATAQRATLVVLQGGSGAVDEVAHQWRAATDLGCTVLVPGRGQPSTSDGEHANWYEEDRTDERAAAALEGVDHRTLLIAGYSAGGREALRMGLAGSPARAVGLLLFGPAPLRRPADVHAPARRALRVWTFVGDDDWLLDQVLATDQALRDAGVEVLEHRAPRVGHVVPDNLAELLPTALDFVLSR
jgi:dienelactone hydrolase